MSLGNRQALRTLSCSKSLAVNRSSPICLTLGGHSTTSPCRMTCIGPPHYWVSPVPNVTIRVCPSGWVCQLVRAPGSKVT